MMPGMTTGTSRRIAVVTGASSGIGAAFARKLAARGLDLIVSARRADRLDVLRDELEGKNDVVVRAVAADLATVDGRAALGEAIDATADRLAHCVHAAGAGSWGRFADLDLSHEVALAQLNVVSTVEIVRRVWPHLLTAPSSSLVIISSLAAWQPTPFMATYAASKAYQRSFTEALGAEAAGTDTSVLAVCPGPVDTEFAWVAGTQPLMERVPVLQPLALARATLARVDKRKSGAWVPGWRNRISALGVDLLPRSTVTRISARIHRPREVG